MNMTRMTGAALAAVLFAGSAAMAANNQIWLKQTIEGKLVEEGLWSPLRVKSEIEEKFDENRIIDQETLIQLGWKLNPYLSIYLGDRWVYERSKGKGKMRAEQRPTFDLYVAFPEFATLKFEFRSRFEYRDKHGSDAYMRYRERLRPTSARRCSSPTRPTPTSRISSTAAARRSVCRSGPCRR